MKKFMISIAVICAMFFFVSCGGSSSESGDKGNGDETNDSETPDSESSDEEVTDSEITDSEVTDEEAENPDEPKELAYPEVTPTSNKPGDIAQNITIFDDLDVEHKLAEWYKPNNPESKLIWLIFTTYDCAPCHQLKDELPEINKPEYEEQGLRIILVFNGLLDGPQPELEPEKLAEYKDIFVSEYPETADFEIYGYLKKEEQSVFKKFTSGAGSLTGGAYPTLLFIDSSTMEVLDWSEGWGGDLVGSTQTKIEILLEEL
jgi:hypothetical protein